jgi:hypothetical protein
MTTLARTSDNRKQNLGHVHSASPADCAKVDQEIIALATVAQFERQPSQHITAARPGRTGGEVSVLSLHFAAKTFDTLVRLNAGRLASR